MLMSLQKCALGPDCKGEAGKAQANECGSVLLTFSKLFIETQPPPYLSHVKNSHCIEDTQSLYLFCAPSRTLLIFWPVCEDRNFYLGVFTLLSIPEPQNERIECFGIIEMRLGLLIDFCLDFLKRTTQ